MSYNIILPFWMNGSELRKIADLFERWWRVWWQRFLAFRLFFDEESAPEMIVNLWAYERNVTRLKGEPLTLFRKRVKYAFENYQDSGDTAGFVRIFSRLGIGNIEIKERFDAENWDVIQIILTDEQLTYNSALITLIIREYGRTCRRYQFVTETRRTIALRYAEFNAEYTAAGLKLD